MQGKSRKKVVAVPKCKDEVRLKVRMWDERKEESAREKERDTTIFPFYCRKPFSSHSERTEGKLGELCDSWWNFVQLLLVSQHNLLNHFRKSLNRLRSFFPVCDTRKKERERERERERKNWKFYNIRYDNLSPRYLYLLYIHIHIYTARQNF